MNIIDYECLACASFKECGTEIGKRFVYVRDETDAKRADKTRNASKNV